MSEDTKGLEVTDTSFFQNIVIMMLRSLEDRDASPLNFVQSQSMRCGHTVISLFFTRDSVAIARICHGNSVCLSVCPSVTRVDQSKMVEAIGSCNFHHTVAPSI